MIASRLRSIAALLALGATTALSQAPSSDALLRAMRDELARSM